MHPMALLQQWLDEEKSHDCQYAQHAVLSTTSTEGHARGRIVAIREINENAIIFFTQKITRKVADIHANAHIALTFWFERAAREVMIEGTASFLSEAQNAAYWQTYPRWAQLRFCSYAPTSGQPIPDKAYLDAEQIKNHAVFGSTEHIPLSPDYCGIRIQAERCVFYTYRTDTLSDVWEYTKKNDVFQERLLSP